MATNGDLSFFEQVWELAKLIPRGRVTSYGAIARALGSAQAARMVGWAMNAAHGQPDVPAHRVVNRLGLLSGKIHFGAPDEMQRRLEAEGITVINDRVVEFDKLFWEPLEELERETILPSPVERRQ